MANKAAAGRTAAEPHELQRGGRQSLPLSDALDIREAEAIALAGRRKRIPLADEHQGRRIASRLNPRDTSILVGSCSLEHFDADVCWFAKVGIAGDQQIHACPGIRLHIV